MSRKIKISTQTNKLRSEHECRVIIWLMEGSGIIDDRKMERPHHVIVTSRDRFVN